MFNGAPNWPGYVNRNDLAHFCQARAIELGAEAEKLSEAMLNPKLNDTEFEALFSKHYMVLGEIIGLKKATDYCAEHKKSEEEMESQNARF